MTEEARKRAQVEAAMDWHHSNTRQGSTLLVWNRVLAPFNKLPSSETLARRGVAVLTQSLEVSPA